MEISLQVEDRKRVFPREYHMAPGLGLAQADMSRGRLAVGGMGLTDISNEKGGAHRHSMMCRS